MTEQDKYAGARENAKGWLASIEEMLEALETTNDSERESAEQTIHESVLSVMVRDGWHEPGAVAEDGAEEYEILLSTGGPALRIYGELDIQKPQNFKCRTGSRPGNRLN